MTIFAVVLWQKPNYRWWRILHQKNRPYFPSWWVVIKRTVSFFIDKNMILFAYKENSILNNGFVRGLNYVVWVLIFILAVTGEGSFSMPIWSPFAIALFSGIGTTYCLERVLKKTTFFEWDYTERKKKERFITCYVLICAALCTFISIDAILIYKALTSHELHWFLRAVPFMLLFFFLFNVLNIVSLFYPLFENDIKPAYKIQKKPENWKDDGPEINDDDEIMDIMRRDFGV